MYTFYYDLDKDEVLKYFKENTLKMKLCDSKCLGSVSMKVEDNKIQLQMKKLVCHPLQRIFEGEISEENNKTVIKGKFKYPIVCATIFSLLAFIFILLNYITFSICTDTIEKIVVSIFFIMLYCVWIFVSVGNKWLYRREDNSVIELLKSISSDYKEE